MDISVLVDIGVIVILLISAGVSFFRGLIKEVLTILGALGGGFAALNFGASVTPITSKWFGIEEGKDAGKLFDLIPMEMVAHITAYAGIFIIVFIILQLASHLISSAVQALGLGPVDRTLGIFFGLVRGLLLLGVLYLPFHLILSEDNKKEWFEKSQTMVFVKGTTEWLLSFVPKENSSEKVVNETKEKLNAIDILGDKRVAKENDKAGQSNSETPQDGYSDKTRKTMEDLIKNKTEEPRKMFNE
jgi:membrane protein required for colicin V production